MAVTPPTLVEGEPQGKHRGAPKTTITSMRARYSGVSASSSARIDGGDTEIRDGHAPSIAVGNRHTTHAHG